MEDEGYLLKQREEHLEYFKQKKINPYPYFFEKNADAKDILNQYKKLKKGEKTRKKVSLAGRIMSLRLMGKSLFGDIQDSTVKIQFYVRQDLVGKEKYDLFKRLDIGDIIGFSGIIFRTKKGEISVEVKEFELLAKNLKPLPAMWHGLKDIEVRYRKRYLDLIMNQEVKQVFIKREKIIDIMRSFLKSKRFNEVETPLLQPLYGGAEARPFITNLKELDNLKLYLSISPEIYLKKLTIGGFERVFTICKNFRNEGIDRTHNPEFTMMEAYSTYWDYNDIMNLTEEMLSKIAKEITGSTKVKYQGKIINFKRPFTKITMHNAIKKYAKIDVNKVSDEELKKKAKELKLEGNNRGEIINEIFEMFVESKLIQPTFVLDYPVEICPLTKEHRKNPKLVERFELFVNGLELANAYSELNDPKEQELRLKRQVEARRGSKDFDAHLEALKVDESFVEAMEYGMPPQGGIGIGIDRLTLFLTDSASIRDVILFPFMKPIEKT